MERSWSGATERVSGAGAELERKILWLERSRSGAARKCLELELSWSERRPELPISGYGQYEILDRFKIYEVLGKENISDQHVKLGNKVQLEKYENIYRCKRFLILPTNI